MKYKLLISIYLLFFLASCQENPSNALVLHYYQLDESLKKSNAFIHAATDDLLMKMEETCKTKIQYHLLVDKAKKVIEYETNLIAFIDSLKGKMIQETGGIYTKEEALTAQDTLLKGLAKGAKNSSIACKILLTGTDKNQNKLSRAFLLDQKMQALSKQYVALLASCWEENLVAGSLFSDIRKKATTIEQLKNQFTLRTSKDYIITKKKDKTWAESTFKNKPLMLVLTNLTAIQNDIITTQYILVEFFSNQITTLNYDDIYDRFEILAHSSQPSVRLGEMYKTEIALGAYSSKTIFEVIINQDTIPSLDGKAIYRVRPNKVGEQKYEAQISITNPLTEEIETFSKEFHFHVIP